MLNPVIRQVRNRRWPPRPACVGDLEQARGLLGHARIETTQLYAQIRPAALKQAVEFYEAKALDVPSS
jgi:hypothetical protein